VPQFEKRTVLEMLGEFLPELAVLIFVFVPLEVWGARQGNYKNFPEILVWTAVVALFSLAAGIVLERRRP
jgi:hypothetical protein